MSHDFSEVDDLFFHDGFVNRIPDRDCGKTVTGVCKDIIFAIGIDTEEEVFEEEESEEEDEFEEDEILGDLEEEITLSVDFEEEEEPELNLSFEEEEDDFEEDEFEEEEDIFEDEEDIFEDEGAN